MWTTGGGCVEGGVGSLEGAACGGVVGGTTGDAVGELDGVGSRVETALQKLSGVPRVIGGKAACGVVLLLLLLLVVVVLVGA